MQYLELWLALAFVLHNQSPDLSGILLFIFKNNAQVSKQKIYSGNWFVSYLKERAEPFERWILCVMNDSNHVVLSKHLSCPLSSEIIYLFSTFKNTKHCMGLLFLDFPGSCPCKAQGVKVIWPPSICNWVKAGKNNCSMVTNYHWDNFVFYIKLYILRETRIIKALVTFPISRRLVKISFNESIAFKHYAMFF